MKKCKLFLFILFLLALLPTLQSCTERQGRKSAAQEFYCAHENRTDITVAYVGGMAMGDEHIDAVMMSADDDSTWMSLKQEFGIISPSEFSKLFLDDSLLFSLLGGLADSIDENLQIPGHSVHVLTIGTNNIVTDSLVSATMSLSDGVASVDLDKVKVISLTDKEMPDNMDKELREKITNIEHQSERIKQQKDDGYLIANSDSTHTIWFFFFRTTQEYEAIMQHVKQDLWGGSSMAGATDS